VRACVHVNLRICVHVCIQIITYEKIAEWMFDMKCQRKTRRLSCRCIEWHAKLPCNWRRCVNLFSLISPGFKLRSTGDVGDGHHVPFCVRRRHPVVLLHDEDVWNPQWQQVILDHGSSASVQSESVDDVTWLLWEFHILTGVSQSPSLDWLDVQRRRNVWFATLTLPEMHFEAKRFR